LDVPTVPLVVQELPTCAAPDIGHNRTAIKKKAAIFIGEQTIRKAQSYRSKQETAGGSAWHAAWPEGTECPKNRTFSLVRFRDAKGFNMP
jgi:hypothetical protein